MIDCPDADFALHLLAPNRCDQLCNAPARFYMTAVQRTSGDRAWLATSA